MASFLKRDLAASKRLKARLKAGELATLCHSSHPAPSLVERLGQHGFDAVMIDCEHASVGRDRVEELARAATLAGTVSILRPEGSLTHLVTGYLGCGIDGLMLPLIMSAEHARQMVEYFQFSAPIDYEDRMLILMIERVEAVDALPEILKIPGIDALMVAPADMALSLGEPLLRGGGVTPKTAAVIDRAIKTIVDAGKVCGSRIDFHDVHEFIDKGVQLLYTHADHMLASGVRDYFSRIRREEAQPAAR